MFGSASRIRRPILLILVLCAFVAIVGVTASAQAGLVTTNLTTTTLEAVASSDAAVVRNLANSSLVRSDVEGNGPDAARTDQIGEALRTLIRRNQILRADIRFADGRIFASDDPAWVGHTSATDADFERALANVPAIAIVPTTEAGDVAQGLPTATVLREYLPLSIEDRIVAVVAVYRDAVPLLDRIGDARRDVILTTITAGLLAAILLFLIFRAAQGRLTRQHEELVRSAREDRLTGLLNHGTMVGLVADAVEAARASGGSFGLALIDIDGFRLVNEHHGHDAGDRTLVRVASCLSASVPPEMVVGRYGPDEFLVIVDGPGIAELEPSVLALRSRLADLSLDVPDPERLPVTISAGIATFPVDGGSLTGILSALVRTLESARASGGDAVRVATAESAPEVHVGGFDILRGLVVAIDTKDRYTKRHSEDVARYGAFLAKRIGLDDAMIATIERAGILHDVGKIGIPDAILHKPGRLTEAEYAIVKQHVALGDMIVRDLPDVDLIRAGILYHHERWDGAGYLAELSGEEIPLIARILAVGDAFSAMTTTRPYRKALDVGEALRRLEDAAGSQLEERLVAAFVSGIESEVDAPLPGNWSVRRRRAGAA